jgi:hypothetical protein
MHSPKEVQFTWNLVTETTLVANPTYLPKINQNIIHEKREDLDLYYPSRASNLIKSTIQGTETRSSLSGRKTKLSSDDRPLGTRSFLSVRGGGE